MHSILLHDISLLFLKHTIVNINKLGTILRTRGHAEGGRNVLEAMWTHRLFPGIIEIEGEAWRNPKHMLKWNMNNNYQN